MIFSAGNTIFIVIKTSNQILAVAIVAIFSHQSVAQQIDKSTALEITNAYGKARVVEGHYYGTSVLKEVIQPSYVAQVLAFKGTDSNGKEHLIFKRLDINNRLADQYYAANDGRECPGPMCPRPPKNLSGDVGKQIDESAAQQMIAEYQSNNNNLVASFTKTDIESLLSKEEITGVYFAHAVDRENNATIVIVGIGATGEFLWNATLIKANNIEMVYPTVISFKK